MSVRSATLVLACLFLAACSEGGDGTGDGGQVKKACKSVLECPTGQACQSGFCFELPCGGRCTEDEVCLNNSCRAADGLDCESDPSVCPSGFQCSVSGQCQRNCTSDDECTATGFRSCNPEAGICGECTFDDDCGTGKVCDPRSARCVGCVDNADCRQDGAPVGRYCDQSSQVCRDGCNGNDDCRAGQRCEGGTATTVGRCVECQPATEVNDCAPFYPRQRCDPQSLNCVECLLNSDCTSGQCDTANNKCVECVVNQVCSKGYVCDLDVFACFPGCAGGAGGPNCPEINPRLPVCDPVRGERGTCVECLKDADCPRAQACQLSGTGDGLPKCVPGCRTGLTGAPNDARCAPTPNSPAPELDTKCDGEKGSDGYGRCVQCLSNTDCSSDKVCDDGSDLPSLRGVCRCKKEGEPCTTSAECGFNTNTGQCNATRAICIGQVSCDGTRKSVPKVCSKAGTGLPDQNDSTGCPSGFVNEKACESGAQSCGFTQCVPATNTYRCQ